jgi:hypothetical protein
MKDASSMTMNWTNPSVLKFAGASDPVELIQKAARLMALNAVENCWAGPPFDPFELAKIPAIPGTKFADGL